MGVKIKKERFENALQMSGLSKIRLAKKMGINSRSLQRSINTTQTMEYDILMKACEVMDVDSQYLIGKDSGIANNQVDLMQNMFQMRNTEIIDPRFKEELEDIKKRTDPEGMYIGHFNRNAEKYNSLINTTLAMARFFLDNLFSNEEFYNRLPENFKDHFMIIVGNSILNLIDDPILPLFKDYCMLHATGATIDKKGLINNPGKYQCKALDPVYLKDSEQEENSHA